MANNLRHERRSYYEKYYRQLVGATITKFTLGQELWPQFTVHSPVVGDLTLEISRDEEGNGPGFIFIGDANSK